jgi:hypothetical protein
MRRREHASARCRHTVELTHRERRIRAVLEHLVTEDDVEGPVLHREVLYESLQLGARVHHGVDADV